MTRKLHHRHSAGPTPTTPAKSTRAARSHQGGATIGTLLGIWAHPDDEAYLSAGLMGLARHAGNRVVVATATRGEHGTDNPDLWPPDHLARTREQEMAASLAHVDVREHHWLDYRDGGLQQIAADRGTEHIARLINTIRPDTIVTFGPDGMTGHPDHQAISGWVTTAWTETGRTARLWYATVTPEFHNTWGAVNEKVRFWFAGSQPPSDSQQNLAYQVRCQGHLLEAKFGALQAHTTQTAGLIEQLGRAQYRRWWSTEYFADAALKHPPLTVTPTNPDFLNSADVG
jgi:LmbE family N-acetylglucosaminyl deacetylase